MRLVFAQKTDVGKVRRNNEDALLCLAAPDGRAPALFAVADGLGGLDDGEIASASAVDALRDRYEEGKGGPLDGEWLVASFDAANRSVFGLNREAGGARRMATTLTACLFSGERLFVAHVGDCRVYRVRDGKLDVLTADHALDRTTLTRAVGLEPSVETDLSALSPSPGDRYLLCSDGLHSMVDPAALAHDAALEPAEACVSLVRRANERGGFDNVSVVCVRVDER